MGGVGGGRDGGGGLGVGGGGGEDGGEEGGGNGGGGLGLGGGGGGGGNGGGGLGLGGGGGGGDNGGSTATGAKGPADSLSSSVCFQFASSCSENASWKCFVLFRFTGSLASWLSNFCCHRCHAAVCSCGDRIDTLASVFGSVSLVELEACADGVYGPLSLLKLDICADAP